MQPPVAPSRPETAETAQAVAGAARSPADERRRWRLDPMPALGILATIGLWYLAFWLIGRYMPPPHEVLANAARNLVASDYFVGLGLPQGGYLPHLLYTAMTVVIGVTIGVGLGCLLGLLSARWRVADQITEPIVSTFGTVPILVAAPFFLIWFGLVASAQLILVAFYTTMIMHIYSLQAVRNVHPKYVEFARTLGADSGAIFLHVMLPGAVPEIAGGVRVAFAASWGLAAIAELLGSRYGVGYAILTFESVYDLTSIMTIILLLGLIALAMDWLIGRARAWIARWAESAAA
jgi:ABC-type nitrate/sulfonate/bicarbonate transport system permease component